jgi:hypothetical protein
VGLFQEEGIAFDIDYARYLVGSEHILCSTFGGHVAVIDPKAPEAPLLRYRHDRRPIHCAAHVGGTDYLLASDTRRAIRFDATGERPPRVGPPIVRDHLEQIVINPSSGRVFVAGFDRTVVEMDPDTLERRGVVLETPFKLRWIHSFAREPETLVVQCRNGALYRANLAERRATGVLKQTPNALWTAARVSAEEVIIAGEGPEVLRVRATGADMPTRETRFACKWVSTGASRGSYAKRMVLHEPTGSVVQGRSDGEILVLREGQTRKLTRLPSPIRDVAVAPEGAELFAVTEDGAAWRVDLTTGRVLARFHTGEEPLWSLAYNHARGLLAVCERQGSMYLLDAGDLSVRLSVSEAFGPKRMRWRDEDRLLIGRGAELCELNVAEGEMKSVIPFAGNTIEDFGWDDEQRFFAICTYVRRVHIFDLATWAQLDVANFDLDFPKGLLWLSKDRAPGAHPYELLVFGRSGVAYRYRVHDQRLQHLGPVNTELSAPIWDDAGVR